MEDCFTRIDNYFGGGTITRAWNSVKTSMMSEGTMEMFGGFGGMFGSTEESTPHGAEAKP